MRKTDSETLKVVQMVLIGSINKNITVNLAKKIFVGIVWY